MGVSLLKLNCSGLSNFTDGSLSIDFITEKRVTADDLTDGVVSPLFGRVYKLNSIAFAGINATGKTTVLTLLSSLLQVFIGNGSLNYEMRFKSYFDSFLEVESFYYRDEDNCIYKLVSTIARDDTMRGLFFVSERLYCKTATPETNKGNLTVFSETDLVLDRSTVKNAFLKKEDSIFSSIMNEYDQPGVMVHDLCSITNHNLIASFTFGLIVPFAQYLDPSIEYIKVKDIPTENALRIVFEVKFKTQDSPVSVEPRDLELYLSSGTIKGISCLSSIAIALKYGGYVLIDEIENHLNKTIAIGLIELFSGGINKNRATLLFSTHYSEILDCVGRSDSIYLLDKDDFIRIRKFSVAAGTKDRKDKRKSDLILSGVLSKAPSYPAYRRLVKSLDAFIS